MTTELTTVDVDVDDLNAEDLAASLGLAVDQISICVYDAAGNLVCNLPPPSAPPFAPPFLPPPPPMNAVAGVVTLVALGLCACTLISAGIWILRRGKKAMTVSSSSSSSSFSASQTQHV